MSDTMLLGVLRQPFEMALSTEWDRRQYWQRGKQAAAEIERLQDEVARLEALIWVQVVQAQWIMGGWGPEPMTKEERQAIDVIVERLHGMALARAAMQAAVENGGHHE
jgi:hypothetical protein